MSRRVAVPLVPAQDPALRGFISAVQNNLDAITGQGKNATPLTPLATDGSATLAQCVAALNIIIARIQGS